MKRVFFSLMAAGLLMTACKQPTKATATAVPANLTTTNPSAPVAPGSGPVVANGAAMKFEYETHDFGKVAEGQKVTYEFNFANVGKSPLIISNAVASCGCTKPEWPTTPIKPGDGGQITVTFNSTGHVGLQDKMITITANTSPAQNVVHLVGEVTGK
jgi:hypothetical protein